MLLQILKITIKIILTIHTRFIKLVHRISFINKKERMCLHERNDYSKRCNIIKSKARG